MGEMVGHWMVDLVEEDSLYEGYKFDHYGHGKSNFKYGKHCFQLPAQLHSEGATHWYVNHLRVENDLKMINHSCLPNLAIETVKFE